MWGEGGTLEYPHIHCFVKPDGTLYEALATLKPLAGEEDKRHFKFLNNLTVPREGTLREDDAVLTVLEKVLNAVVYGEDISAPPPAKPTRRRGKQQDTAEDDQVVQPVQPAVVVHARYVAYAKKHSVELPWVTDIATKNNIPPEDIDEWSIADLKSLPA
ncbi:hypothetical protein [Allokutzneria multivorans]|uniref:hypothetical protein n=1 Tax=Allokutzneria multivorans TaxID=1142134 RepID=UPI0031EB04FD